MPHTDTPPVIALVVPCYNEEKVLPLSAPQLLAQLDDMARSGLASPQSFVMCVDDGSRDTTWSIITALHAADSRFRGIRLAHNRGQQAAIVAGLEEVAPCCDAAITIDADLQDPLSAVTEMVKKFREGADIVFGVRSSRRTDTWFKRNSARLFYKFQQSMGVDTIYDHSDFRLMSRRALGLFSQYDERNLFIRGIMKHIGLPSAVVTYERSSRLAGETKYSPAKLMSLAVDGITSFTARPMRLIFSTGLVLLLLDIGIAAWVLISHFQGRAISGWSSIMLSIWFLGSLILMAIGIIGEYVGKIYIEVKHRPRYAIQDKLTSECSENSERSENSKNSKNSSPFTTLH